MKPPLALVFFVFLHGAQSPAFENFLDDLRRMTEADTNDDRFNALTAMLRARNLTYSVQLFTLDKPNPREPRTEGRNVMVAIGTGTESIVVGAHYDAVRLPDGTLSRGAVDNAASSVILVRLAEALRADDLPRQVKVIWFDMEELGLIGSRRYIDAHGTDGVIAMLNFDVNGYGDTVLYGPSERDESRNLRRHLTSVCAAEARSCVAFPRMPPGDDRSFVGANIPTLSIAALPAIEAHQLWLTINAPQDSGLAQGHTPAILRTIHTHEDTAAKVDGETMTWMLRFAHALVREVARSSAKPAN
jgi:Zn-dependent M28 family amino/carboxypeptidase